MAAHGEILEEQARVIKVDDQTAWVETEARSGCSHCTSSDCTTSVVARLFGVQRNRFALHNGIQAKPGDQVIVGIPGRLIARASVLAYLVPLFIMLMLAFLGSLLEMSQGVQSLFALSGLLLGLVMVNRSTRESASRLNHGPQLLRVVENGYRHVVFPKHIRSKTDE